MALPEFSWTAAYANKSGEMDGSSGTLEARSLESARSIVMNRLAAQGFSKIDLTIGETQERNFSYG